MYNTTSIQHLQHHQHQLMSSPIPSGYETALTRDQPLLLRYPQEGHRGHAPHCIFCYTRYCIRGIAKGPPPRLSAAQEKEIFRKRYWRRVLIRGSLFFTGLSLAILALYYGGWTLVWTVRGQATVEAYGPESTESGINRERRLKTVKFERRDRELWFCLFLLVCSPLSMCIGFVCAGGYYIRKFHKKQEEKELAKAKENLARMRKEAATPPKSHEDLPSLFPTPEHDELENTSPSNSSLPTISLSRVDTVRRPPPPTVTGTGLLPTPAPVPARSSRNRTSVVGSVVGWWEDQQYKWPGAKDGYVGTEQRRSNFQNEVGAFEMGRLQGGDEGAQAHRQVGGDGGQGSGGTTGGRSRDRESTMTVFPTL
ncbi:hypothetical protein P280DRAFT_511775 [Massarina eburnea CBS 473.64]|uniref:Transmembrane protein n=1 Tax=Massarina eburnea CBS 473.64 TaxID=1395130 RepID=A0A6A6RH47_9PLEO|nr:hypothetical protein P280DRAFT_511775 [Massarina eburnea CBS 473.64]